MGSMAPIAMFVASMATMVGSMATMASMAPMTLMVLASVALVASMVWVTALKRRKLSNEMLSVLTLENLVVLFDETGLWKLIDPEARDGLTLSK